MQESNINRKLVAFNFNTILCTNRFSGKVCPAAMAKGLQISYNPFPRAYGKIQLLGLDLILYFACSPRKWVITTTCMSDGINMCQFVCSGSAH